MTSPVFRNNILIVVSNKITNKIERRFVDKIEIQIANRTANRIARRIDILLFLYECKLCHSMILISLSSIKPQILVLSGRGNGMPNCKNKISTPVILLVLCIQFSSASRFTGFVPYFILVRYNATKRCIRFDRSQASLQKTLTIEELQIYFCLRWSWIHAEHKIWLLWSSWTVVPSRFDS